MDQPRTEPSDAAAPLTLPAELTIYSVGELHPAWLAWVAAGGRCVDGSAVDQVDAAGLQLLLSLAHSLEARGTPLQLSGASRVLEDGCAALGLASWLASHQNGVPA